MTRVLLYRECQERPRHTWLMLPNSRLWMHPCAPYLASVACDASFHVLTIVPSSCQGHMALVQGYT